MPSRHSDNSDPLRGGIYTRMSIVAIGDTTKVDDQERISRDLAASRNVDVAEVYCDNNKSAWRRDRKRPGWDRMLADVEAGNLDAIIVYHGDRLIRQPWDLERLLALAESKGIRLLSPSGTRNLDNSDDRFILRIEAAQACRESDNTSRRRKAQYARWRREGRVRPGGRGGRAFGFETDGVTHVWAECEVIRDAAQRILGGESTSSVARDIAGRGWDTPAGAPMSAQTLKKMLKRERMAGLMPGGEAKAAWEPVLDRETWERVCLVLDAKAETFSYASNARRYLLSGIAVCACGTPLQANPSKGRNGAYVTGYACRDGCKKVYRSTVHLDAYVGAAVVAHLSNPLNPEGQPLPVDHAAEWAALQRERAETETKLRDYKSSAGMLDIFASRIDGIDKRMAELRDLAAGDSRTRLLERYAGITRQEWEALPLDVRRALVAACFTVTVLPASKRGPGFRTEDVRLEPV